MSFEEKKDKAKGKAKEMAGDATGDDSMRREGKADRAAGNAKGFVDDMKERGESLIDSVRQRIKR